MPNSLKDNPYYRDRIIDYEKRQTDLDEAIVAIENELATGARVIRADVVKKLLDVMPKSVPTLVMM